MSVRVFLDFFRSLLAVSRHGEFKNTKQNKNAFGAPFWPFETPFNEILKLPL
jgi:hypothetical protein